MAIAAWKRFEKTPQWQRKKRFLTRLIGKQLRLRGASERVFAISGIAREVSFLTP